MLVLILLGFFAVALGATLILFHIIRSDYEDRYPD